jgi:hypothetical protein
LPEEKPYKLTMKYDGLIGVARGADKIWAFLVNANYDPNTVEEENLPPGMYQELGQGKRPTLDALMKVPPHYARIRFTNAEVKNCARCERVNGKWEVPLQGDNVTLNTPRGLGNINLDGVANYELIAKSRKDKEPLPEGLLKFDTIDLALLSAPPLDKRLAGRVMIEAGAVLAKLTPCGNPPQYTFKLEKEGGCPGVKVSLAEELVVTQEKVKNLVITVGAMNISVAPTGPEVIIEVLNQTKEMLATPCYSEHHLLAARWFYRLLNKDGQKRTDKHYRPCVKGDEGPPDCPQWKYELPAGGGR